MGSVGYLYLINHLSATNGYAPHWLSMSNQGLDWSFIKSRGAHDTFPVTRIRVRDPCPNLGEGRDMSQ